MSGTNFAGDVRIESAELYTGDGRHLGISGQIVELKIFEELFKPFRTIAITVRDSLNFVELFPFIGEEYIDIKVTTPGLSQSIEGKFTIYQITDRIQTKDKEVIYTLKGISIEWLIDVQKNISQKFQGNCSEIAGSLFKLLESKRPFNAESAINETAFISNFWSPVKGLYHLCKIAKNPKNHPSFLFYENNDGFNFKSVNTLLGNQTKSKFVKNNYIPMSSNDPTKDYAAILNMQVLESTNLLDDMLKGRFKSTLASMDSMTGNYQDPTYTQGNKHTLLNPNKSFTKVSENQSSGVITSNKSFANFDDVADASDADMVQNRNSFFADLKKFKTVVEVYGKSSYTVGQVMELEVPPMAPKTSQTIEKVTSGKYLLISLAHYITRKGHVCSMELVKNSLMGSIT